MISGITNRIQAVNLNLSSDMMSIVARVVVEALHLKIKSELELFQEEWLNQRAGGGELWLGEMK